MAQMIVKTRIQANGTDVPGIRSWNVSHRAGALPKNFSLTIQGAGPDPEELLDIHATYGAGALVPLIEEGEAKSTQGQLSPQGYISTFQGVDAAEQFVRRSPEKEVIYLAREYIDKHAKGYEWKWDDDTGRPVALFQWSHGVLEWPIKIPELPDHWDEQAVGTFEAVAIQNTADEIVADLASKAGVNIENGCPRTPFRGAFVLGDSQTYFQAIKDLVSMWNPLLTMHFDGTAWTLFILDVESAPDNVGGGTTFDQDNVVVNSVQSQRQAVVNKMTVLGHEIDKTWGYAVIDMPLKERKPIKLTADYVVERKVVVDPDEVQPISHMPSWAEWGITKIRKEYARDPTDINNRILIREQLSLFEYESVQAPEIFRQVTTWDYLDYTAAIGENREEHQRVQFPGEGGPSLRKIKEIQSKYGDYVDEAGEVERQDLESGYVLFDYWHPPGGFGQYRNPREASLAIQAKTIDLSPNSNQSYIWGQIRRRHTRYEVEDTQRVRKDTTVFENLDGTVSVDTEYIPINYDYRQGGRRNENRDRWDFTNETSIAEYGHRPRVELSLPDLKATIDDDLVDELWDRVRRRSGTLLVDAQLGLPAWTPLMLGEKVTINPYNFQDWNPTTGAFEDVYLPAGDYYVTGVQHNYESSPQSGEARLTTTINLRSKF